MNSKLLTFFSLTLLFVLSGCNESVETSKIDDACINDEGINYLCGLDNAEDILQVGDSQWLLISGMNGSLTGNDLNGKLHLVNHKDKSYDILFPGDQPIFEQDMAMFAECPGPVDISNFSVHGLSLQSLGNDQYRLYITSHGAREAIEAFAIDASSEPTIKWIGCVPMPASSFTNSIAILDDGGFYATQFMETTPGGADINAVLAEEITGHVFEWHPGQEVSILAGTEMSGPNGIVVSEDQRWIYVAGFGTKEIVRFDTSTKPMGKDSVKVTITPDNIRWTPHGTLYSAGNNAETGTGWGVVEINPDTLAANYLIGISGAANMHDASAATLIGNEIWIGTYSGDRVGIIKRP